MVENTGCGIRGAGSVENAGSEENAGSVENAGSTVENQWFDDGECEVDSGKACPHSENRMLYGQDECLVRNLTTLENFEVCVLFAIYYGFCS